MRKLQVVIKLWFLICFFPFSSYADFAGGGDIRWKCIGRDSFLFCVTFYYDCNGPNVFDKYLVVKSLSTGQIFATVKLSQPAVSNIVPVCNGMCTLCSTPACSFPYGFNKYVYNTLVVLKNAGASCEIKAFMTDCCYSTYLTNLYSLDFHLYSVLNRCISPCDNSPTFNNDPVMITCKNHSVNMSLKGTDSDSNASGGLADSFTYEMSPPLINENLSNNYVAPFSFDKPLGFWSFPNTSLPYPMGFHLERHTGNLSFTPIKNDVTVLSFKISEYRSGVKIAEIHKEQIIFVINCPTSNTPYISYKNSPVNSQYYFHENLEDTLIFRSNDNDVGDSVKITYETNIKNATIRIQNGQTTRPYLFFKWKPSPREISNSFYYITVTLRDNTCPFNHLFTRTYMINVKPVYNGSITIQDLGCNTYSFKANINKPGASILWTGDGFFYSTSDSFVYHYTKQGSFPVKLKIGDQFYSHIYYDTVFIKPFLYTELPKDTIICSGTNLFIQPVTRYSKGTIRYVWSTGDTIHSSITAGPFAFDKYIRLTVNDSSGCPFTDSMKIMVNQQPFVDAGKDSTACGNGTTMRIGIFSTGKYAKSGYLKWYCAGDTATLSTNPVLVVSKAGTYILRVRDNINCSSVDSFQFKINPKPVIYAGNDKDACSSGGLVPLHGIPDTANNFWTGTHIYNQASTNKWYFDPSGNDLTNGGIYPLVYHYYDSYNCSGTDTMNIRIYKPSAVKGNPIPDICLNGSSLKLTGTPAGGTWTGNGITNGNIFSPLLAGAGTHKIVYHLGPVCDNTDTVTVRVMDIPHITLATSDGKTVYHCASGKIKIMALPAGGILKGSGLTGEYFNTDTMEGSYTIYYTITNTNGCTATDSIILSIKSNHVKINGSGFSVCQGIPVSLHASVGSLNGCTWYKNNLSDAVFAGNTSSENIIVLPGSGDATNGYTMVYIRTNDTLCPGKDSIKINVYPKPVADFLANPFSGKVPLLVSFQDKSTISRGLIKKYLWKFGDGDSSNSKSPMHYYLIKGIYDVQLLVSSDNSCPDTLIKKRLINADELGVDSENAGTEIDISPNPSSNIMKISLQNPSAFMSEITVFSSAGIPVRTFKDLNRKNFLLENPGNGIYYLKITLQDGQNIIKKIIFK